MVHGAKQRALEKLAFHFHRKNKKRSAEENWKLAEKMLDKIYKKITKNKRRINE
jgi:hypothetical protein